MFDIANWENCKNCPSQSIADMFLILICEYHDECVLISRNFLHFASTCVYPFFLFFFYIWLIRSTHPFSFLSYGVFCVLLFFFVYVLYFVCQCLCSFTIALNVYTNLRFLNWLEELLAFPIFLVSFGTWRNISSCCNLVSISLFMRVFVVHEIVLFCYLWYCVCLIFCLIIFSNSIILLYGYLKIQCSS
jgi:hypothetical protein